MIQAGRFQAHETPLFGVLELHTRAHRDERGSFERLYCQEDLAPFLGMRRIVQVNRSITLGAGTLRGIHYQAPPALEAKIVTCLRGAVWDVAVDLRAGSATWGQWHGVELTAENRRALLIPEGCGHGFQVLADTAELLYFHTAAYAPAHEGGVDANDPVLAIEWPLPIAFRSPRDQALPPLGHTFIEART